VAWAANYSSVVFFLTNICVSVPLHPMMTLIRDSWIMTNGVFLLCVSPPPLDLRWRFLPLPAPSLKWFSAAKKDTAAAWRTEENETLREMDLDVWGICEDIWDEVAQRQKEAKKRLNRLIGVKGTLRPRGRERLFG
jgi:hypothetical protein